MKGISLFFLLIPLVATDFDCKISPYVLGLTCFYQYFSSVGNNYTCSTTFVASGKSYLLSMEMLNIGTDETLTVTVEGTPTISNNGSSVSLQQYFSNTRTTISITTGNNSTMAGIFFICPADVQAAVPTISTNVSYGQEAFILQQFPPPTGWGYRKLERTKEMGDYYLLSDTSKCPTDSCMQLIWFYDGIGENAKFIGTAADFNNKLHLSTNTTATIYFVTMDFGTDSMAVIANEEKNLEHCSTFNVAFYNTLNDQFKNTLNVTGGDGSGACLTVLNHCYNEALCDGVVIYSAINFGNSDFYVYAGAPHPDPINARLVLENYSQQNGGYPFPQNFAGNARTFSVANGTADLFFGNSGLINQKPLLNRQGFLMTNFYPFYSANMYGGSLDLDPVTYSYNITLRVNMTYAPPEANAYLSVYTNGKTIQSMGFDTAINVGIPMTVHIEANAGCRITLWGGSVSNQGSYATYFIEAGEITTTTVTTPTPSTASTSPGSTVSTTVTDAPTTTPLVTTTGQSTVISTSTGPTDPTTTPKAATEVYFFTVTVFSVLLSLV